MKITFKQRIMAAVVMAALIPMCLVGGLTAYMGFENSRNLSEAGVGSVQEATKMRLIDYLETVRDQVKNRAEEPYTLEAFKAFVAAENAFDIGRVAVDQAKLKERYSYQASKTKGAKPEDADAWMPK
jgi:hypothetical protein